MSIFYIQVQMGGELVIKVEAENLEQAKAVAADYTIDDWEEAGPMKLSDVRTHDISPIDGTHYPTFDASLVATGDIPFSWDRAEDDPLVVDEIP